MKTYLRYLSKRGIDVSNVSFVHGAKYEWDHVPALYVSYHPSPQNTYTKVLTMESFQKILKIIQS